MNLINIEHSINVNDVYEYYFMKNLYSSESWLFDDYDEMLDYVGGYYGQFTSLIFKFWLERWGNQKHNKILLNLETFIDSEEYQFDTNNLYKAN
jgi:Lhr-like helicase